MIGSERRVYLRRHLRLTRQELADLVGVAPMTIYRWETNKSNIRLDNRIKLTAAFRDFVDGQITATALKKHKLEELRKLFT